MLEPPAARGSDFEKDELAELHRIVATATPERLARAREDDVHEDPTIFNEAIGTDLSKLPVTSALLMTSIKSGGPLVLKAKSDFMRLRPWAVDATLANCDSGRDKKSDDSYPSGHATLGYGVGMLLANLIPEKASAILARARDYGYSRLVCGKHFPSDVEASRVIATYSSQRFLNDPAMSARIAAARAELKSAGITG